MPKKMFKININKIREQDKNEKEKKMEDIKSQELNTFEKKIIVLKEEKTTNILVKKNTINEEEENKNILLINDSKDQQSSLRNDSINNTDSTIDNSNRRNDENIIDIPLALACLNIEALINENNFNFARKDYYLKFLLSQIQII